MYEDHHRHAQGKPFVFGFVAADFHPHQAAKASANGGHREKQAFRNAPELVLRIIFVNKHKHKGKRINYYQAECDNIHKSSFPEVVIMKKYYTSPEIELEVFNNCRDQITTSFEVPDIELEDIPELDASEF